MTPVPATTNRVQLALGHLLPLGEACGTRLECHSGVLWITLDNDPRDLILEPGQACTLDSDSHAIVQPILGPAAFSVTPKAVPCPPPVRRDSRPQALRSAWSWKTAVAQ